MAWTSNRFNDFTSMNNNVNRAPSRQTTSGSKYNSFRGTQFKQSATGQSRGQGTTWGAGAQGGPGSRGFQQQSFGAPPAGRSTNAVAKLENLHVGSVATVIGVVIAKESPRSIFSRINSGTERHLMGFVLRDSPTAFVPITCWGGQDYIRDMHRSFSIGDVVKVSNVQVQQNASDGSDEKFRVSSPLAFHLSASENHCSVSLYEGLDLGSYAPLHYIPIKPSSDYYTLEDVLANGQTLNGEHISLLVVVRKVGPARDITTKAGKHTKRCEVKLFDESCASFPLVLWGEDLVDLAQSWTPIETVLFVGDVRMNYDDYRSGMLATADSKTVITPNPDTPDAKCLFRYGQTQTWLLEEDGPGNYSTEHSDPPLADIQSIIVVEQIASREGVTSDYAQLYAAITKLDLDAENTDRFFRRRCAKCKQMVTISNNYQCTNQACTQGALGMFNTSGQITLDEPDTEFSIPVDISDHTGTVHAWLSAPVLESMIGFKVEDLLQLPSERRTQFKWGFLLERCKFYIRMIRNTRQPERSTVKVLVCSRADPAEMMTNISR
ncbi:meiosis-specific with OB domain-containing protein-like [Mya arenaria]|uniref:meiosis-specific with OB domain-containing protein-like n=1 Tax=Mya arenaria TaxID=6604 RepID=UPI0022E282CC|nr:meiosis-specific with OB domain-containing protein-like [Mya arenaria]